VHQSLRANGCVLVVQPAPVNSIVELQIGGDIEFRQELKKPIFRRYQEATAVSLRHIIDEHLFVMEHEATTPVGLAYHPDEYDSLDEWIDDRRPLSEDLQEFDAITASMQEVAKGREHRVVYYSREYKALLRKSCPPFHRSISSSPMPGGA
jgi:hypothetical protein